MGLFHSCRCGCLMVKLLASLDHSHYPNPDSSYKTIRLKPILSKAIFKMNYASEICLIVVYYGLIILYASLRRSNFSYGISSLVKQVEILCQGQPVLPTLLLNNLVDLWFRTAASSKRVTASVGTSAKEFVMVLSYCRKIQAP